MHFIGSKKHTIMKIFKIKRLENTEDIESYQNDKFLPFWQKSVR
jgi:hypothetical protein